MRRLWLGVLAVALGWAHDPISTKLTYTREISRLLIERCGRCHREGGPAPMSLLSYAEVRPWAKAIKEEVLERRMPPGGPVRGFGALADDTSLSQEELHIVADWVEGGAPEGDPVYLPTLPREWTAPKPAAVGPGVTVKAGVVLRQPLRLGAVAPAKVAEGGSVKAAAQLPDGWVEPLVWLHGYRRRWKRNYALESPLRLPAGTKILIEPPQAEVVLYGAR